VRDRLSNPEPFFPKGPALSERAQLGMARGEVRMGDHGRQEGEAKTLAALRTLEGCYGLRGAVDRSTKVALVIVDRAEEAVRQRPQDDFPTGRGEPEGALGGGDGLVIRTF
jgi:hypothetical protein